MKSSTMQPLIRHLCVLVGSFCFAASVADAQDGDKTIFAKMYENTLKEGFTSPLQPGGSLKPGLPFVDSPYASRLTRGAKVWCQDGNSGSCKVIEEDDDDIPQLPEGGANRHSLNVYAPMAGFTDTMFSKAHANQLSSVISSPMVLYNTTMLLTEPGVAGGIQNSVMQGYAALHTRYQAEEQFYRQIDNHPETKELVSRAYQDCIAQYIRDRSQGDSGADQKTWIAAQSVCMADRYKSLPDVGSKNGENFDSLEGDAGRGFNFGDDFSHAGWYDDAAKDEPGKIYLSDYVFNRVAADSGLSDDQRDKLRSGFWDLIGDYEFKIERSGASNAITSASREIGWKKTKPGIDGVQLYKDWVDEAYINIMSLMEKRCVWHYQTEKTGNPNMKDREKQFWQSDSAPASTMLDLSMSGYKFTPAMGDMIYNLFNRDLKLELGKDMGKCAELGAFDGAPSSIEELAKTEDRQIFDGHRSAFFLAQKIALARIFGTLKQCEQVVLSLSSGSQFDNFIKNFALQLIYEKVGTLDLEKAHDSFTKQTTDDFAPAIGEESARTSGNGSKAITDAAAIASNDGNTVGSAGPTS